MYVLFVSQLAKHRFSHKLCQLMAYEIATGPAVLHKASHSPLQICLLSRQVDPRSPLSCVTHVLTNLGPLKVSTLSFTRSKKHSQGIKKCLAEAWMYVSFRI